MLAEKNSKIKKAFHALIELSWDEETRMLYESREKARRDEYARMEAAMEEGLERGQTEGITEGKMEEKEEIARNLLRINMPAEDIAKVTGLELSEIKLLK